ncbi:MAG: pyridoxamine 5'-phosphate oxidase family protein [Methanothrix sp.]|nr:MAG: pyridoxamine 5'-phosphate oxidase family protein [Methanothrix sp.]
MTSVFTSQSLAVLATQKDGRTYANLVSFAATEDLKILLFTTSRSTRKFSHILDSPQVALLIDNRTNSIRDLRDAVAVTALGKATVVEGTEKDHLYSVYLAKHPHLIDFMSSPNQAFLKVEVSKYILVSHFQRVLELNIDE